MLQDTQKFFRSGFLTLITPIRSLLRVQNQPHTLSSKPTLVLRTPLLRDCVCLSTNIAALLHTTSAAPRSSRSFSYSASNACKFGAATSLSSSIAKLRSLYTRTTLAHLLLSPSHLTLSASILTRLPPPVLLTHPRAPIYSSAAATAAAR